MKQTYIEQNSIQMTAPHQLDESSIVGNGVRRHENASQTQAKGRQITTQQRIVAAFSAIIMALLLIGSTSIYFLQSIATATDDLFSHPFKVSNAVRDINLHVTLIQSSMKDIVLSDNNKDLNNTINKVHASEHQIFEDFHVLYKRFLGDKKLIDDAYDATIEWRPIRDKQIELMLDNDIEGARIFYKTEGEKHASSVIESTQVLLDYALNKADELRYNSSEFRKMAFIIVLLLFSISTVGSIFIAIYVVQKLIVTDKEAKNYLDLIDQNILIATFDKNLLVKEMSNSLCRFLRCVKNSFDDGNKNFFIPEQNELIISEIKLVIQTGQIWRGEYQLQDNEGDLKWVKSEIYPVIDEDHSITGYRNIISDIGDKKEVEAMSYTDKLTSLYNRRYFDEVIKKEINLAKRNGNNLTLAILDVDHFKKYNDRYGHPAGDLVLSEISYLLKGMMRRPNDYVFRLGGEEFGIVCSGLQDEKLKKLFEKVRLAIEAMEIEHLDNDASDFVSISIGAQTYQGNAIPSAHQFYINADKALYDAKKQRNAVISIT